MKHGEITVSMALIVIITVLTTVGVVRNFFKYGTSLETASAVSTNMVSNGIGEQK